MKKLFALLAVAALTAVGCDDKKTTGKPSNATTGATYDQTNTVRVNATTVVQNTVVQHTATITDTKTVQKTVTVPEKGGPGIPPKGPDGK